MPRSKKLWLASSVVSVIVIAAIVFALIARIPSAALQLPPNTAPLMVVLSNPTDGSTWPVDTPVPVTVMVTGGAPIKNVEFWTDGRLFDTQIPSNDRQVYYKVWFWLPLTEGTHAAFVRATDANGRTADSNAVHIQASAAAGLITVLTAQGGETIQSLAEQNGITTEQIAAVNPSIDPVGPLAPGALVFIPGEPFNMPAASDNPLPSSPGGPVVPAVEGLPGGPSFYLERTFNSSANVPAAPALTASVEGCNVTLTIQDNSDDEDGFFVYALPETSVSFKRITSLKAHTGAGTLQYIVQNQRGHVEFYGSAYSAAGESPSAPVAVDVTGPQCDPSQAETGGLKFQGGILVLPNNLQLAYFYASINGGAWQRIPLDHQFLEPVTGQIDLRTKIQELLGGQASGQVDLDVWGWNQGELVHVGQIHISVNFASLAICKLTAGCSGDMGATQWVTDAVVGSDKLNTLRNFRWSASGADITYAIWQVSTQPFPPEYSVGAPPGLVISGISDAAANGDSVFAGGTFAIDFNTDLQFQNNDTQPVAPERKFLGFQGPGDFESLVLPELAAQWQHPLGAGMLQALLTRELYIRAMPMAGGHPATDPSNTVHVSYQPTGEQPPIHIYNIPTYSVEIVPDSFENEVKVIQKMGILGCSDITGVDHDVYVAWYKQALAGLPISPSTKDSMAETSNQFWVDRIGLTLCPGVVELPEDSILDQIAAGFKDFFNTLSSTLELVKGTLVDALASIIPFCDSTCKTLLMTGLNFTITYFTGLPPSIPNFDEVVSMGIDYAVQLAITQSGIPYCDELCQGKISDEIKGVAKDVANSGKSQPGCAQQNFTLWLYEGTQLYHLKPLCIPPGISYLPLKGSMYERAMVQVRVTRIDGSPNPVPMQNLVVDTHALNAAYGDGHTEKDYYQTTSQEGCMVSNGTQHCVQVTHTNYYDMTFNAPLEGTPYPQKTITVPALKPGQSVVIPVVFEGNYAHDYIFPDVYAPRAIALWNAYPGVDLSSIKVDWNWDYSHLTDSSTQITINAQVLCQDKSTPTIWNSPCSELNTRQFIVP